MEETINEINLSGLTSLTDEEKVRLLAIKMANDAYVNQRTSFPMEYAESIVKYIMEGKIKS